MLTAMHTNRFLVALLFTASSALARYSETDQFTPVVASTLTANTQPVPGTDGRYHVVYELMLTNTMPTPARLEKIEIVDARSPSTPITVFQDHELLSRLRTLANTASATTTLEFNSTRLFLIDLSFDSRDRIPGQLRHQLNVLAAPSPGSQPATPVPHSYSAAPLNLNTHTPVIGPPLAGKGWAALNGCCAAGGVHRASGLPVNGRIHFAQRFAIDWMRLDKNGRLVHGDASNVRNYPDYGAEVLAVADGRVVSTLNTLSDQPPGMLPDPKTITIQNVDGNHIVLDLGGGVFAFYGHMQKNSITVAQGQRVKRGQVLGKLGNTGNTSGPHLHFHLMDGPSVLGSSGIPYVIDTFAIAGQIPSAKFAASSGVEGDWSGGLLSQPSPRKQQFPLDLAIVDFPSSR